jgi:hypothetical protein
MEIKALDNSNAGAGVHVRLYFKQNTDDCYKFALKLRNYPSENDQNDVEMSNIWTDASFGAVTRRSAMRSCKNWKTPSVTTSPSTYPNLVSNYKSVVELNI